MCDDECAKVDSSYTDVNGTYGRMNGGYMALGEMMTVKPVFGLTAQPVQIGYTSLRDNTYAQ
ncbi:MAG TPA: hypothetical protein VJG30_03495 [Candidatus Nanoarchaeia archaeon]|nr:hypothetical protein [Candidatus Nanoarchaeia archaeon]